MLKRRDGVQSWTFFSWLISTPLTVSQVAVLPSWYLTARSESNFLNCQSPIYNLQDRMML